MVAAVAKDMRTVDHRIMIDAVRRGQDALEDGPLHVRRNVAAVPNVAVLGLVTVSTPSPLRVRSTAMKTTATR